MSGGAAEDESEDGGRAGVGRVEAFSDGVIAIVVTIMVLELHPPAGDGLARLMALWPTFLAYALSYAYVAIYWVNHHRLFGHAMRVTNALLWSNMLLLFALSLVPFATAYLGQHRFGREATLVYLVALLLPVPAYVWLQATIRRTGRQDDAARRYHRQTLRKGVAAGMLYVVGIALSFAAPWLGIICAGVVALLWFLPAGPADRLFGDA